VLRFRESFGAAVMLLLVTGVCASGSLWGQQATLVADAHVSSAQPAVNSGELSNLNVGNGYTALVQFDLSTLPAGTAASQVSRATLRLYCNRADAPGSVQAQMVDGPWTESAVTYATLPQLGPVVQTAQVAGAGEFVTFDVTSAVQGWVGAPGTNFGLALIASTGAAVQFDSKENDQTAHAPQLDIALVGNGTPGPQGVAGAQGITGEAGAQGPVGAVGAQGPIGLSVQGTAGPQGAAGLTGAQGAQGLQGLSVQGPSGPQGPVGAQGSVGAQGPAGPLGATGARGIAGEAGAQGIPGVTGATGLSGPMGPVGPAGPVGMGFAGAYASTTNYGIGDGVMWQGAGWVSLVANNQGNTPSLSPLDWAMFAASGAAGATGSQGPAGAGGLNGINGLQGAAGPVGPTGATGAEGSPGLLYRGAYSSVGNYALGDVVIFGGASWVSLLAENVGETPGVSPAFWGVLTSQGTQGAAGPMGLTGSTGPAGPQGFVGAAGPAGVAGPIGIQGPAGAQGLTGSTGATGSAGPQGSPGVAGTAGAQGVAGATGPTGLQGATGATGSAGPVGPAGTNGTNGLNGTPGLTWRGAWNSIENYAVNEAVSYGGGSYLSTTATNLGQRPDVSPASWAVLAQGGTAGAAGATGAQGLQGTAGAAGTTGAIGATGATGAAGAVGTNFRGVWNAAAEYLVRDAVTFAGSTYLAQVAGRNAEPDLYPPNWAVLAQSGGTGATGAQGAAAVVSIGMVTTLAAGSQATVTNTGSPQAAILNFGIPQGIAGAAGNSGSGSGTSSGTFAAMYHGVSFAMIYYAVNTPNANMAEASVLAWVPQGCTATELEVYSQQSATITVTLRAGFVGALQDTPLSCSMATNSSCKVLGFVVIAAGEFIDLRIDSASGVTAGVWTSLQCQ